MAILERLTLEETLNLKQHRVFRAVVRLLLQEINAARAFDVAKPRPQLTVAQVLDLVKGLL